MIRIYRYSCGDAQLLMVDGRNVEIPRYRKSSEVHSFCLLHQTDGLVIVDSSDTADYKLECYSSDGLIQYSEDALRCSAAFADLLGVKDFHTQDYTVECMGVVHSAHISSHLGEGKIVSLDGGQPVETVCMGMID